MEVESQDIHAHRTLLREMESMKKTNPSRESPLGNPMYRGSSGSSPDSSSINTMDPSLLAHQC